MLSRSRRLALTGLALGVLLALVAVPQTRWLVRLQTLTCLRLYRPLPNGPCYTSLVGDQRRYEAVAARHPDDFAIQYAAAVSAANGYDETLKRLQALATRFPDRPALYANVLRYETIEKIRLDRPEENLLAGLPVHPYRQGAFNAPADLGAYDQAAAAGERIDPDNAYFPLMRAVGLFAAFRDAEGLAAFQRASEKPRWQEYCADDVEARWRLHEEAFGDPGALGRVTISASLLLPQFSRLRALARLILVKAIQEEQAGHREEGLKLRESLIRCGDLMRVQSTDAIESLVASAICTIATDRTGGMTLPKAESSLTLDQRKKQRLETFCTYVLRLGHPEAAARARAEDAAGRQVDGLVQIVDLSRFLTPLFSLAQWWLTDVAVLSNVLWLLLLGGLAAALARRRQIRDAKPLSRGVQEGFWTTLVPSLGLLALLLAPPQASGTISLTDELSFPLTVLIAIPLAGFGTAAILTPRLRPLIGSGIRAALITLATVIAFGVLAAWQTRGLGDLWTGFRVLTDMSGVANDADSQAAHLGLIAVSTALGLAIPFLLILVSTIVALVRRVPVSVGLVQSSRAAALPTACLLLLVWGGLLLGTVRQEHVVSAQVWHQVHDEGPYLAAQAGQSWPGPVR